MSLLDNNSNAQPSSSNNQGKSNVSSNNPLFELIGSVNLISSSQTITEVTQIVKSIEDTLEQLDKNTATTAQKMSLPKKIQQITSDISPNLPGIALSREIGGKMYVLPALFYKTGVTEVTESIFLQNESVPRGIAKPATSFMDAALLERIKTTYRYVDNKQMTDVVIISPHVINLETYIKNSIKTEDAIIDIRNSIMNAWSGGLMNIIYLDAAKENFKLPSPFKDGKLFGKDDAAVARVEPVSNLTIDGRPSPHNLSVKMSTTNKNNTQNQNNPQTRSVANTFLTVSLEAMNPNQFMAARQRNPGVVVGPLVPVISTGVTQPGETLNNNTSMLTALLGLYASIGANNISYFSEALRGKKIGNRGNIGNFNFYLTQILQGSFGANNAITDKNITNAQQVNNWMNNYVAQRAVYVLDLPSFSEDVANSDFWWNIIKAGTGSVYHRALISLLDILSNGEFSKIAAANASKPNRNPAMEWAPGDNILKPTNIMIPNGIALGEDGRWFSLAEVDGMFLRQEKYYGNNEMAVSEYQGLIGGQHGAENPKVRQFNIYTRLQALFSGNVIVDRWDHRLIWQNGFLNTFSQAMAAAGVLSLSGSNMASMWTMNTGNDYLNDVISAVLVQNVAAGTVGMAGSYTHY